MEDDLKRFDMDAVSEAFYKFVRRNLPQSRGRFFRDATGIRWRFIATTKTTYVASHGEYGAVMVVELQPDGTHVVTIDLKKRD